MAKSVNLKPLLIALLCIHLSIFVSFFLFVEPLDTIYGYMIIVFSWVAGMVTILKLPNKTSFFYFILLLTTVLLTMLIIVTLLLFLTH